MPGGRFPKLDLVTLRPRCDFDLDLATAGALSAPAAKVAQRATTNTLVRLGMAPPAVVGTGRRWSSSNHRELQAGKLAERAPRPSLPSRIENLVMRPAEAQPAVHAGAQPRVGPEVAVGHLQVRELGRVEHLALGDE